MIYSEGQFNLNIKARIHLESLFQYTYKVIDKGAFDEVFFAKVVKEVFKQKELLIQNDYLSKKWFKLVDISAQHLNLHSCSKITKGIKLINRFINNPPSVLKALYNNCQDPFHNIFSHLLTLPYNKLLCPIPPQLAALACTSKIYHTLVYKLQASAVTEHINLNAQKRLLAPTKFNTVEDAVDFIIENQLQVANLKGFKGLNEEHLKKLFTKCPTIKHLMIQSQSITKLPSECSQLETLDCSLCCEITHLPSLPKLISLNCSDCAKLTNLPAGLDQLVNLDCSDCHLMAHLPEGLDRLTDLNCSGCNFAQLPVHLGQLINLDCKMCKNLTSLPQNLRHLKRLNCSGCHKLKSLPEELGQLTHLATLAAGLKTCQRI